jgi:hypothetical protein
MIIINRLSISILLSEYILAFFNGPMERKNIPSSGFRSVVQASPTSDIQLLPPTHPSIFTSLFFQLNDRKPKTQTHRTRYASRIYTFAAFHNRGHFTDNIPTIPLPPFPGRFRPDHTTSSLCHPNHPSFPNGQCKW